MGLFGPKLTPEQTQTLNVLQNAMEALYINSKMYFREHKSEFDIDPRFLDPTTYNESDVEKVRVQRWAYKAFINELKNRLHECNKDFLIANHLYTSEGDSFSWPKWVPKKFRKAEQKLMTEWLTIEKFLDETIESLNRTSGWIRFEDRLKR